MSAARVALGLDVSSVRSEGVISGNHMCTSHCCNPRLEKGLIGGRPESKRPCTLFSLDCHEVYLFVSARITSSYAYLYIAVKFSWDYPLIRMYGYTRIFRGVLKT